MGALLAFLCVSAGARYVPRYLSAGRGDEADGVPTSGDPAGGKLVEPAEIVPLTGGTTARDATIRGVTALVAARGGDLPAGGHDTVAFSCVLPGLSCRPLPLVLTENMPRLVGVVDGTRPAPDQADSASQADRATDVGVIVRWNSIPRPRDNLASVASEGG